MNYMEMLILVLAVVLGAYGLALILGVIFGWTGEKEPEKDDEDE